MYHVQSIAPRTNKASEWGISQARQGYGLDRTPPLLFRNYYRRARYLVRRIIRVYEYSSTRSQLAWSLEPVAQNSNIEIKKNRTSILKIGQQLSACVCYAFATEIRQGAVSYVAAQGHGVPVHGGVGCMPHDTSPAALLTAERGCKQTRKSQVQQ